MIALRDSPTQRHIRKVYLHDVVFPVRSSYWRVIIYISRVCGAVLVYEVAGICGETSLALSSVKHVHKDDDRENKSRRVNGP